MQDIALQHLEQKEECLTNYTVRKLMKKLGLSNGVN